MVQKKKNCPGMEEITKKMKFFFSVLGSFFSCLMPILPFRFFPLLCILRAFLSPFTSLLLSLSLAFLLLLVVVSLQSSIPKFLDFFSFFSCQKSSCFSCLQSREEQGFFSEHFPCTQRDLWEFLSFFWDFLERFSLLWVFISQQGWVQIRFHTEVFVLALMEEPPLICLACN